VSDDEDKGRRREDPPTAPPKKLRVELRRSATGESLLSSFLRRLYFVTERIFIEMHAKVVDAIAPLLIPAILSHPNPGSSIAPPKAGGPRVQRMISSRRCISASHQRLTSTPPACASSRPAFTGGDEWRRKRQAAAHRARHH
jgi:hypothetical protein